MAIDARQLRERGVYESRVPLGSLLQDLDGIGKLLAEIASGRSNLRKLAGLSALAGLLCGIASAVISKSVLGVCALLGFTFGVVLFIYSFFYGRKLHKHRERLATLQDLSKFLRQDADMKSPFSARLVFAGQPKMIREEPWTARKSGKQAFLAEEFLSVEGELLDGTVLTETVTELSRKRTYRNPRGKLKTKIRCRYLVALRLSYPTDVYGDARPASQSLGEEIRVPSSATVRDTRVTEKAIVVKALVILREDVVQTSAMLCMGAYRILNLARRVAVKAPGEAS